MATPEQTKDEQTPREELAAAVGEDAAQANLLLAWRRKTGYNVQFVELEAEVAQIFIKYARDTATQLAENRAETPYQPEWPLGDHQYFALDEDDWPGGDLFEKLADFLNLDSFKKDALRKPKLYVVAVQTSEGNAFFGRRMAYLQVLGNKRGVFNAIWDGSTFSELTDSVATFATSFEWVVWGGTLYVLDATAFHAEFRDAAEIQKAVAAHVATIQTKIKISGADEFIKRCQSSVQMASKLKRVADDGIWGEPIDELKTYAEERGLDVVWTDDDELAFDGSIENQWSILKLLDEDRTEGPVSGRTYDSAAKVRIEDADGDGG
ncbi:MAG: hypothetical protein QOH76_3941 [Thermoleophilaceae bacterium]|jgi:hypothetical protein|nr:hypothetical protein [Thermoleophilaceae bacterium]